MNMLQVLKSKVTAVVAGLVLLFVPMLAPALVAADAVTIGTCLSQGSTLSLNGATGNCTTATGQSTAGTHVDTIIATAINIFSIVVGIIAVTMIIYAGFKYVTSGGEDGKISSAKSTILYAVIGLVVVAFAQFVVQFVLNKLPASS